MLFAKNKKGLVLAEALIAVTILMAGVFMVSMMIDSGARSVDRMVKMTKGKSFAVEAVEVVKNVRDSNKLARPRAIEDEDITNCWRVMKPVNVNLGDNDCDEAEKFEIGGPYVVALEQNNYVLERAEEREDLGEGFEREINVLRLNNESADLEVRVYVDDLEIIRRFTIYNYVQ